MPAPPLLAALVPLILAAAPALVDKGVFSQFDGVAAARLPAGLRVLRPWLRLDGEHGVATLYDGPRALAAFGARVPAGLDAAALTVGKILAGQGPAGLALEGAALSALRDLGLPAAASVVLSAARPDEDRDGDGIVDRLDALRGARKLLANRARYESNYRRLAYPGGDVPRSEGVCTDTVVRALRNAGIDLQKELHEDIARAPRAYPMVKRADANIDHRRVKVLLPWLTRHLALVPAGEPTLPGDIVLFDTFPRIAGPDHIGVASDRRSPEDGSRWLVINNWTDGAVDAEMDLLGWVPVTHRFRLPEPSPPAPRD